MAWPYQFVDLNEEQRLLRRNLLGRYGAYAQSSALVPLLVYQLYRLTIWATSEREIAKKYTLIPGSPLRKSSRQSPTGVLTKQWRRIIWWLEGELCVGWGLRGHWIVGASWASWLMFLSVHKTGDGTLQFLSWSPFLSPGSPRLWSVLVLF
jgi:hypothetical protein